MEIWDSYDRNGRKLGFDLIRGEKIPDGAFHMVCNVLVRHSVSREFLIMQRDFKKPYYPGMYEATAGGSALKGENEYQCIKRELFEETGISEDSFLLIDTLVNEQNRCIYYEYYCETDCDKSAVRLQENETVGYEWVNKDIFEKMLADGSIIQTTKNRMNKYFTGELFS